jgi:signal transduction histidine kinase
VDELLDLSRVGRITNPPTNVSFDAVIPFVNVDRARIVQVLQNLIPNASKFIGDTKEPTIEIGVKEVDGEHIFFVRDNGMGIAPEFHERIFGLFNKPDQFSDGTGIGLALVKRIIEMHGGRIWVESESGKGTTFFFTLENKNIEETK